MEEEEAADRIRYGLKMMKASLEEGEKDVTVIVENYDLIRLVEEETGVWGWIVKTVGEMWGAESDRVVVVGGGSLEPVSRCKALAWDPPGLQ